MMQGRFMELPFSHSHSSVTSKIASSKQILDKSGTFSHPCWRHEKAKKVDYWEGVAYDIVPYYVLCTLHYFISFQKAVQKLTITLHYQKGRNYMITLHYINTLHHISHNHTYNLPKGPYILYIWIFYHSKRPATVPCATRTSKARFRHCPGNREGVAIKDATNDVAQERYHASNQTGHSNKFNQPLEKIANKWELSNFPISCQFPPQCHPNFGALEFLFDISTLWFNGHQRSTGSVLSVRSTA